MSRLLTVAACLLLTGSAATIAQDYPHAFPRTGTKQLIDNARVTVWEVNWQHGVKQPYHRHLYDMAGVYLRYGVITVTNPDGTATSGQVFEVPRPYFQRKGITHREEALGKPGDAERLAIMVDLKDAPAPSGAPPTGTPAFPRDGAKNVLENERVRMWDYTWTPGDAPVERQYAHDSIEVIVTGGSIRTRTADGQETVRVVTPKEARFVRRGHRESQVAASGAPRAITIELK